VATFTSISLLLTSLFGLFAVLINSRPLVAIYVLLILFGLVLLFASGFQAYAVSLERIYTFVFGIVPVHVVVLYAGILGGNHIISDDGR
jgi:hypothetical protein